MRYALYLNGLGNGKTRKRERLAMRYLARHDIEVEHVPIDWRSDKPFEKLFARLVKLTKAKLKEHGQLVLIGSSAGGSLALNIFKKVNDKNLSVVTLCSRLHEADLAWWDRRSLQRMAYIGAPKASQLFVDSVTYCSKETIPSLTKADKQRIAIVRQLADDVVPKRTMGIEGVKTHKVLVIGHGWGIAEGVRRLPQILTV
jgi:pimeloyl-ACP methyl ester carboxylesterase